MRRWSWHFSSLRASAVGQCRHISTTEQRPTVLEIRHIFFLTHSTQTMLYSNAVHGNASGGSPRSHTVLPHYNARRTFLSMSVLNQINFDHWSTNVPRDFTLKTTVLYNYLFFQKCLLYMYFCSLSNTHHA